MLALRKSLAIVLTLVVMLTMLVPTSMAAPQWAHGVTIGSPTGAKPAYVNPEGSTNSFDIKYNIAIVGTQVDNVNVWFKLLTHYIPDPGNVVLHYEKMIPVAEFVNGSKDFTYKFVVNDALAPGGEVVDGWYDLKVCVQDIDPSRDMFCDTQVNAVLVQDSGPRVDLEKPGVEEYQGATFVTGKAYLMVGQAWDDWGIAKVEFQYCDWSNNPTHCSLKDPGWVKIANGTPTPNVPNQWDATWDTTAVPDDAGAIRMCVWNKVGLSNCDTGPDDFVGRPDAHKVWVTNRFVIDLEPGWNLISLPALPYNPAITDVLFHLIAHKTVQQVVSFAPGEKLWTPDYVGGPQEFNKMTDGKGYWIYMSAEDKLDPVGTYLAFPPMTPPEYPVNTGWNLVGYTQFGRPWWLPATKAADYLSASVAMFTQSMWRYDANLEIFLQQPLNQPMVRGSGFWLAMSQPGTIRP
jgi:hypothetical protein